MKYFVLALALIASPVFAETIMFESGGTYTLQEGEQLYILKKLDVTAEPAPLGDRAYMELCRPSNRPAESADMSFEDFKAMKQYDQTCDVKRGWPWCDVSGNRAELCSPRSR